VAVCLAACLAVLSLPGAASALPSVRFKVLPLPIPGFSHTGYIAGAGADLQTEYEITGSEYFGSPPPVIGINFYLPNGSTLHPSGFPTCALEVIRLKGPSGCPKGSRAGPTGTVLGYVSFGGERVEESVELFSFFGPGNTLVFLGDGHSPVSLEVFSTGRYIYLNGAGGFGIETAVTVPLVASVPGAPYASVKTITGRFGAAIAGKGEHGTPLYYGRVPSSCPKAGFPVKTEVIFAENGELSRPETVTKTYTAPCPRK
jgi:hypothetical protein